MSLKMKKKKKQLSVPAVFLPKLKPIAMCCVVDKKVPGKFIVVY